MSREKMGWVGARRDEVPVISVSKPLATGPWWTPEPGAFSAPLPAKLGALLNSEASIQTLVQLKLLIFIFSPPANNDHHLSFLKQPQQRLGPPLH